MRWVNDSNGLRAIDFAMSISKKTKNGSRSLTRLLGRKAAKATVRHSANGLVARARRQPLRSTSLLIVGAIVGLLTGWSAGRGTARRRKADS